MAQEVHSIALAIAKDEQKSQNQDVIVGQTRQFNGRKCVKYICGSLVCGFGCFLTAIGITMVAIATIALIKNDFNSENTDPTETSPIKYNRNIAILVEVISIFSLVIPGILLNLYVCRKGVKQGYKQPRVPPLTQTRSQISLFEGKT